MKVYNERDWSKLDPVVGCFDRDADQRDSTNSSPKRR